MSVNNIIGFGKYFGQTIEMIGDTDEGLLYLDKLVDDNLESKFKDALKIYLKKNAHRIDEAMREDNKIEYHSKKHDPLPQPWWEKNET